MQQQQQQPQRHSTRAASIAASKKIKNTLAVRRNTRQKYRKLQEDVKANRQQYIDPNSKALGRAIAMSGELIKVVDSSRECVMDGEVLHTLSTLSNVSIQNLDTANRNWKPDDFAPRIAEFVLSLRPDVPVPDVNDRLGLSRNGRDDDNSDDDDDDSDEPDNDKCATLSQWAMFGRSLLKGWKTVPTFDTTASVLHICSEPNESDEDKDKEKDKDKQPAKPKGTRLGRHPVGELERPDDVTKICETTETETSKRVMEVFKCVKKAYESNGERPVNLWRFILNPDSYGQTIENLFYLSFLVKDGTVGINMEDPIDDDDDDDEDNNELLMIQPKNPPEKSKPVRRVQNVLNIDWVSWKKYVNKYGAAPPLIPPRAVISHEEHINSFSSSANLKRSLSSATASQSSLASSTSSSSSSSSTSSTQSVLSSQHKRKKQRL